MTDISGTSYMSMSGSPRTAADMPGLDTGPVMRTDMSSTGAIDAYVAELAGALRGPRRAKADLLVEAHDSLVDATEAYERNGFDREAAEEQAVREFGDVAEVVVGYQAELALAQGQRTAWWIVCALAPQGLAWEHVAGLVLGPWNWAPTPAYVVVNSLMPWLGVIAIAGGLLASLACGVGNRYLRVGHEFIRATGVFALAVSAVFPALGVLMTLLSPAPVATGLLLLTAIVLVPMLGIAVSARRCLTAA
jgi:hypothetical protein